MFAITWLFFLLHNTSEFSINHQSIQINNNVIIFQFIKHEMGGQRKLSYRRDFHDGPVVKNLPSNAEDVGSIPGLGTEIPHATVLLSPYTAN